MKNHCTSFGDMEVQIGKYFEIQIQNYFEKQLCVKMVFMHIKKKIGSHSKLQSLIFLCVQNNAESFIFFDMLISLC